MLVELADDQSERNVVEALRALELAGHASSKAAALLCVGLLDEALIEANQLPLASSQLIPNPVIVARAEIRNAIRYRRLT